MAQAAEALGITLGDLAARPPGYHPAADGSDGDGDA
jgi:hypothetical protein